MLTFLVLLALALLPLPASAWNIPGHMLSAAIAYQVLQQESPQTIDKVKAVLEKHPSYPTNGRPGPKTFLMVTAEWWCFCRRQIWLMISVATTSSSIVRCGTTSIGRSSQTNNR